MRVDPGGPDADESLEASRLLLELVHVVYATRAAEAAAAGAETADAGLAGTATAGERPARERTPNHGAPNAGTTRAGHPVSGVVAADRATPSTHAIRAAIYVHQHGMRTIGELAEGLGISYGWASRVVTELETNGMAERHVDPVDRRMVRVLLTQDAAAMVERTYRWRSEAIERAMAGLDARERRAVRTFLHRVIEELARTGHGRRD
jgi:DNA-binding MarR family transcriptional regulator